MITSKFILSITEKYSGGKLIHKRYGSGPFYLEVFENPTSSDYSAIRKSASEREIPSTWIKFVADFKNKKFYAANGYDCEHEDIGYLVHATGWEGDGKLMSGSSKLLFDRSKVPPGDSPEALKWIKQYLDFGNYRP